MRRQFLDTEFPDPMLDLVTLKHTITVEDYYEYFLQILNSLQLLVEYSMSVFISNLKLDISKIVRLFSPQSFTQTLNLAKQLEAIAQNPVRKPFIPYRNAPSAPPNVSPPSSSFKPYSLPPLLFTLNLPQLPSSSFTLKSFQSTKPSSNNSPQNLPKSSKIPTRQEKDEMRRNELCIWCGVKFVAGYNCLKS